MKIIILGAGQVGASVAHNLASEDNDITLVDINPQILQGLQDRPAHGDRGRLAPGGAARARTMPT